MDNINAASNNALLNISDKEFKLLSGLVYERSGINLTDKKKALLRARLNKVVKELGLNSFKEYYGYLLSDNTGDSITQLLDKISTNHSYFFRESGHFDFMTNGALQEIMTNKKNENSNSIKIWCAGCATGEEPYSLAMVLKEYFNKDIINWDVRILATDISYPALTQSQSGIYQKEKIEPIQPMYRTKYFKKRDDDKYQIDENLQKMILFKRLNLMDENYPFKGKFDIIFCRNVMIYFDKITKDALINKFYRYLNNRGYLFIGHSESISRETTPLKYVKPSVYKRVDV